MRQLKGQINKLSDLAVTTGTPSGMESLPSFDEMERQQLFAVELQKRKWAAEWYELRLDREAGRLVRKDQIMAEVIKRELELKDLILAIPRRLASQLPVKLARKIEKIVREECVEALNRFPRADLHGDQDSLPNDPAESRN